jgi:uncharacterized protein YehS (DUF1456 family)
MVQNHIACTGSATGDDWALYQGDCVEVSRQMPPNSVDLALYSPPFSSLYTYSDSERDMGNSVDDDEFLRHYRYLVDELFRIVRPGRIVAVHCKDLVNYKGRDGESGLRDFPGELIRVHREAGFAYHSRTTVWKCPVVEMQRTKSHGLLYKQLRADSTFSRQGLAEYVLAFRRWPKTEEEAESIQPVTQTRADFSLNQWQEWASPVWMDINQTNVLNAKLGRDELDERHMCPLQLDLIERCVKLWSNPGDVVLSPFAGVGSEGVVARRFGRRFVGVELKESYFKQAQRNLEETRIVQRDLFAAGGR